MKVPNLIAQPLITIHTYQDWEAAHSAAKHHYSNLEQGGDLDGLSKTGSSSFDAAVVGDTRITLRVFTKTYPPHPTDGTPAATITLQRVGEKHPVILKFNY